MSARSRSTPPAVHLEIHDPLWREVLGARLRALRRERELTLVDAAARAGISPQYLSEIERGRKEPSSEMIAAVLGALDLTLLDLTGQVTLDLRVRRVDAAPGRGPVALALVA